MRKKTLIYSLGVAILLFTGFAFTYSVPDEDSKQIMTIIGDHYNKTIIISTPSEVKEIKIEKTSYIELKQLLAVVAEYRSQGWNVKATNMTATNIPFYYFYLEK